MKELNENIRANCRIGLVNQGEKEKERERERPREKAKNKESKGGQQNNNILTRGKGGSLGERWSEREREITRWRDRQVKKTREKEEI